MLTSFYIIKGNGGGLVLHEKLMRANQGYTINCTSNDGVRRHVFIKEYVFGVKKEKMTELKRE